MLRALLLLVPLLLAGCVNPAAELDPTGMDAAGAVLADTLAEPVTTVVPISLLLATPVGEPADSEKGEVVVKGENATLLVEAQWSCTSPTCGFYLVLFDDEGDVVAEEHGTGRATLQKALKPGKYVVGTVSSGPAAGMAGEIRATEFDGPVEDGFTAF